MKIMTQRSISLDSLRKNLRMLWKTNKWVNFSELEAELFLVEFGDGKDKKKILDMSPWSYEKQLVIIQEFEGELTPKEMELKWSPFWIQIFNLPLINRTKETGWAIGSSLGDVMEVDVPDSGVQWGKCLRVRVRIDITKRLIRGKKITVEGGEPRWVQFKYERLPNFCYYCGLLSHSLKDCSASPVKGQTIAGGLQYGAWMRGDPFGRSKDSGRDGGGEYQGGRDRGEGPRPERTRVLSDEPKEKTWDGGRREKETTTVGNSSLVGDDAPIEEPRQLTATSHGKSKGAGSVGIPGIETPSTSVSPHVNHSSQSDVAEEMQWANMQDRALGRAPSEVNPISTPNPPFLSIVSDCIESEEDIPPGFEGQLRRLDVVTKVKEKVGGPKSDYEQLENKLPEVTTGPSKGHNGPWVDPIRAKPSLGPISLDHHQDQSLKSSPYMTVSPHLNDISNLQHTKHAPLASGPKWTRVLRSSSGSKEALFTHAGQKRGVVVVSDQLELPNKKSRVFQDDKENSDFMAVAGSQHCQGL